MKTTPTTAANNLLIDYNKKIDYLNSQITYNQKLIETDKATINSFKEKINILHEVLNELNSLNNTTPPKAQCNLNTTPIKPLTEDQIKNFNASYNSYQKNSSKVLEDALKSLEDNVSKDSFCFVDVKYNDHEKWPMDM